MKKKIALLSLLLIVAFLSCFIDSFGFILLALMVLSVIFLVLAGILRIFKKIKVRYIKIPLITISLCLVGILVSLIRPFDDPVLHSGSVSEKLEYAYETDQGDRMKLRSYLLGDLQERDEKRLEQVKKIYGQKRTLKPLDKFHAAFIFHHSDDSKDYAIASILATAAAKDMSQQDNYQVQWLRKAAYDRWMLSIGKAEKYNTQNKFSIGIE